MVVDLNYGKVYIFIKRDCFHTVEFLLNKKVQNNVMSLMSVKHFQHRQCFHYDSSVSKDCLYGVALT